MGIVAFRKVEFNEGVSFVVSRLVYAVEVNDSGSGQVMIDAMVTASPDTQPFSALELIVPHRVNELVDRSETYLDEKIRENHLRYDYKVIDKQARLVNLSGLIVRIIPISASYDSTHEFDRILITYATPFRASETRAFRIMYNVPSLAHRENSVFYGWRKLSLTMSFYDKSILEHADTGLRNLTEDVARIAKCERVYLWLVVPGGYDVSYPPVPLDQIRRDYDETFLSRGKKTVRRTALSWEYASLSPWVFQNRIHICVRKETLGVIRLLGLGGFFLALTTLILRLIS